MKSLVNVFRILAIISLFTFAALWGLRVTAAQFSNPALTPMQVTLQTYGWLVPIAVAALFVAIFEYCHQRL